MKESAIARALDNATPIIVELVLQIGAIADANDARSRVATQHVGRERYRGHEGFKRPRRRNDNQALNYTAPNKLKVIRDSLMMPVHVQHGTWLHDLKTPLKEAQEFDSASCFDDS